MNRSPVTKKKIYHIITSIIANPKLLNVLILYIALYVYNNIRNVIKKANRLPNVASGANIYNKNNETKATIKTVNIVDAIALPNVEF